MAGNAGTTAVAWAGLLLGAAALGVALSGGRTASPEGRPDDMADLASPGAVEGRLDDLERRVEAAETRLSEMEPRVAGAEGAAAGALGEARRASALRAGDGAVVEGGAAPLPADDPSRRAELDTLLSSIRSGGFSSEGAFALMERARALGGLDEALKEMEAYAAANATDPAVLVNLGLAYSSKLLSVPEGPERGGWAMKALQSFENALKVDPDNWDARYHKAFNLSQWPAFLNRQPEAIRTFEELMESQEKQTPEPRHAQTYIQLGNTYGAAGNSEKALEVYRRGLALFPGNETLRKQVELLEKR